MVLHEQELKFKVLVGHGLKCLGVQGFKWTMVREC